MTHFDRNKLLNIDVIVEEVKLKERILIFLGKNGFVADLERNCVGFHQKLQSQNKSKDICDPFYANLSLKFGDLEDGKLCFSHPGSTSENTNLSTADLLYLVTKETKQFLFLVEEVTLFSINKFFENCGSILRLHQDQIHIAFSFCNLPIIPQFRFSIQGAHINCSLSSFNCIVSSKSPQEQYV
jgi:hypothetical protein